MNEYQLEEDRGHIVTFFEYGNPDGVAILSFHGGPGSGSKPAHAERFDLRKYRVILFDQRGCGKSTPLGSVENNTTDDLLLDAERIREKLGITEWFVTGSSWGATLSLLYALKYPKRVRGLLISAIFLADTESFDWAMTDPRGVARILPDVWAKRMEFFKKFDIKLASHSEDVFKILADADVGVQKEVAAGVRNWESNIASVQSAITYKQPADMTEADIASVKIFVHYEMNQGFIPDGYILEHIDAIADMPTVIVHGRYDILCLVEKAQLLKDAMRNCEMFIADSSGHMLTAEGEMIRKIAFDRFIERQLDC